MLSTMTSSHAPNAEVYATAGEVVVGSNKRARPSERGAAHTWFNRLAAAPSIPSRAMFSPYRTRKVAGCVATEARSVL